MLRLLTLVMTLSMFSFASAQDEMGSTENMLHDDKILENELVNDGQSRTEFQDLVKSTINLMGPESESEIAESSIDSEKTVKN